MSGDKKDKITLSDQHNARGIELADRGLLDEAVKEFRKAIDLDPESAHAHDNLATVFAEKKRFREALAEYIAALELDPDAATAHYNLANFLATHGLDLAVEEYRASLALDPEHPDTHLNLGLTLADRGDAEEAERALRRAVELAPKDAYPRHELAALQMDGGDYRAAIGQLKEVVKLEPESFEAHLDLGICYAQKGFYAESERAYARARAIRADDVLLHYNTAALYALWGRPSQALEHLALAVAADGPRVKEWLRADRMFEALEGLPGYEALVGR
ncbi:MAG TPA: tetratricopeptide repeat protein [Anaeromyxobacteraceae bacterium]|nr:tetratricopeptide repeat protein [Anaeromyxobacteraceae bacterium]